MQRFIFDDNEHNKSVLCLVLDCRFLDASTPLFYMRLCLSVRPSIGWSIRPSVRKAYFQNSQKRVTLTSEVEVMSRGGKRRKEGHGVVGEGMMMGQGRGGPGVRDASNIWLDQTCLP